MSIEIVPAEAETALDWRALTDALKAGHALPRAEIAVPSSTGATTRS